MNALAPTQDFRVAFGVVPWDARVRLPSSLRSLWDANGWAVYPTSRHYSAEYKCWPKWVCTPASGDQNLPSTRPSQGWRGCLDEHRVVGGHADLTADSDWLTHPSQYPFALGYFPAWFGMSYECQRAPRPYTFESQSCYRHNDDGLSDIDDNQPMQRCKTDRPRIFPLTTDSGAVISHIQNMKLGGGGTHSALGLLWGQRVLSPDWRDVWDSTVHPMDPAPDLRKAIVLLTDGSDSYCGGYDTGCMRTQGGYVRAGVCTAVKAQGTEIFVVAADSPRRDRGRHGRRGSPRARARASGTGPMRSSTSRRRTTSGRPSPRSPPSSARCGGSTDYAQPAKKARHRRASALPRPRSVSLAQ